MRTEEQVTVITDKTRNTLIELLERIIDDNEITTETSGGCSSYETQTMEIYFGEDDAYSYIDDVERILKLCKGDVFETREENINALTQKI